MASHASSEQELLEAETRRLQERGYTIYRGRNELVPPSLKSFAPDAIAVGREPKYLIEVVREGSDEVDKLKALRQQLSQVPGWELLVVLDRGSRAPELQKATAEQIDEAIRSAQKVLSLGEAAPALLLAWGVFEGLSRNLVPTEFARPQSPGRLIQILASEGYLNTTEEQLLRSLAKARNAVIHGELSEGVERIQVEYFLNLLIKLQEQLEHQREPSVP
jgi:uncharacterized protein YutE (UPF0331/DUF86 family)